MQNTQDCLLGGVVRVCVVTNINTKSFAETILQDHLNYNLCNLVTSVGTHHASKSKKDCLNMALMAYEISYNTIHCIPI